MKEIFTGLKVFAALTVLTGVAYPLVVTGVAQVLMPTFANGSLIERDGVVVGSELIGQKFDRPEYFWGRPSATGPDPYNAASSAGSNLGPTNPDLLNQVEERVAALKAADPGNDQPVPADLVTASGSGLDPHISLEAAMYQVSRVAKARGMEESELGEFVRRHVEKPAVGVFGERVVNVLKLNLALDGEK